MNKKPRYVTASRTYYKDGEKHTLYGIELYFEDCPSPADAVYGISEDGRAVKELAMLCNALELSPVHLWDVCEDLIYTQNKREVKKREVK